MEQEKKNWYDHIMRMEVHRLLKLLLNYKQTAKETEEDHEPDGDIY